MFVPWVQAEPTKSTGDALYNAALHGDTETVRVLCNTGAPVNFTNVNDWSPLSIAAHKNHVDCVAILAAHRADINTQNKFGLTPLIFAAQQEGYETVRLLIALGADLELCGTHGTAQHYANGCCVELLQNTVKGGGSVQQLRAQNNEAILSHPEAFPAEQVVWAQEVQVGWEGIEKTLASRLAFFHKFDDCLSANIEVEIADLTGQWLSSTGETIKVESGTCSFSVGSISASEWQLQKIATAG